jgi:tRNA pseudouridine38-40 synthase
MNVRPVMSAPERPRDPGAVLRPGVASALDDRSSSGADEALRLRPEEQHGAKRERFALVIAYRGTEFHGFASQPGQVTVGGSLSAALGRMLRHPVTLTCAGRTDSGVHASGQVVSFDTSVEVEPALLVVRLNRALGPDIAVRHAQRVSAAFDARRSATGRRYRYRIHNHPVPDPLCGHFSWQVASKLDLPAMRLAGDALLGEQDFSSFCRRPPIGSLWRNVREVSWRRDGVAGLTFEIEASSFCHQMVRSVVGTLVEVGLGRRRAGDLRQIIAAADRSQAGGLAPAHGLCLWEVTYPDGALQWPPTHGDRCQ